jgi:chitinase
MKKNVLVYYQQHYNNDGTLCKITELKKRCPSLSTVCVGCFHVRKTGVLLNHLKPDDKHYDEMWADIKKAQKMGVKVVAMVGGYSRGSFWTMVKKTKQQENGKKYFLELAYYLKKLNFDGIDLDIEEKISLDNCIMLIKWIRQEFGKDFIIQMAPVASAMYGGRGMSGFSYIDLDKKVGNEIAYYCAQFYCGWGTLKSTAHYNRIINQGVFKPSKIMAGTITYPERGFVPVDDLAKTITKLSNKYADFAGVFCWEYALSLPGAKDNKPYIWAEKMHKAMEKT